MRLSRYRADRSSERLVHEALRRVQAHRPNGAGKATPVQLLGQGSGAEDWPEIHAYWTRRSGLTGSWPKRLGPTQLALNLWPLAPAGLRLSTGTDARASERQPRKLLGTPALICFDTNDRQARVEYALARAIASWVADAVNHNEYAAGLDLAPPILEEWEPGGHLRSRSCQCFRADWQLGEAMNVAWPPPSQGE